MKNNITISEKSVALIANEHLKKVMNDQEALHELIGAIISFFNGDMGLMGHSDIFDDDYKEQIGFAVGCYPSKKLSDLAIVKSFEEDPTFEKDVVYITTSQDLLDACCPSYLKDILSNYPWGDIK